MHDDSGTQMKLFLISDVRDSAAHVRAPSSALGSVSRACALGMADAREGMLNANRNLLSTPKPRARVRHALLEGWTLAFATLNACALLTRRGARSRPRCQRTTLTDARSPGVLAYIAPIAVLSATFGRAATGRARPLGRSPRSMCARLGRAQDARARSSSGSSSGKASLPIMRLLPCELLASIINKYRLNCLRRRRRLLPFCRTAARTAGACA